MSRQTLGEQQESCIHYDEGCLIDRHDGSPTVEQCAECMDYRGPSRGMGDQVAKLINITRLDTLIKKREDKWTEDGGCKCGKRRAALNRRFPKNKA